MIIPDNTLETIFQKIKDTETILKDSRLQSPGFYTAKGMLQAYNDIYSLISFLKDVSGKETH